MSSLYVFIFCIRPQFFEYLFLGSVLRVWKRASGKIKWALHFIFQFSDRLRNFSPANIKYRLNSISYFLVYIINISISWLNECYFLSNRPTQNNFDKNNKIKLCEIAFIFFYSDQLLKIALRNYREPSYQKTMALDYLYYLTNMESSYWSVHHWYVTVALFVSIAIISIQYNSISLFQTLHLHEIYINVVHIKKTVMKHYVKKSLIYNNLTQCLRILETK